MSHNLVGWFEIYVQNLARARAFYETVFAIQLEPLESPVPGLEMLCFPMQPTLPGASGALVHMPGVPTGSNSTLVYFSCADCALEASRVVAAGGHIKNAKMPIGPHGFIALVVDTEGNLIGLHSRV
jgi:hypothetical protein